MYSRHLIRRIPTDALLMTAGLIGLLFAVSCDDVEMPEVAAPPVPGTASPVGIDGAEGDAADEGDTHLGFPLLDPGAPTPNPVAHLAARMAGTAEYPDVAGDIFFHGNETGLKVMAVIEGLPPGDHAFHVHALGDCTAADGSSAGPHFNFVGSWKDQAAVEDRITGNLGMLEANDDGVARFVGVVEEASATGAYAITGRSVVIHAQPNDPEATPGGGAGARIACGTIGITQ